MSTATLSPRSARPPVSPVRGLAWVTWRQHRFALAGLLVVLGGVGISMLFNGLAMHSAYTRLGLSTCGKLSDPSCQNQLTTFQQQYMGWSDHLPQLVMLMPGLIGVFVGAPLVARELESGTFRFVWTLARSRVQWVLTKLVLLAAALTVGTLAFSALATWWYGPFDAINGRLSSYGAYEITGVIFTARTLFAFAVGALLGLLIRRTVPAMAATAAIWIGVVVSSVIWLRPLIAKPISVIGQIAKGPIAGHGVPSNATVVSHWFQDATGHHVNSEQLFQQVLLAYRGKPISPDQFNAYLAQHHINGWVSYRPNGWFWHFQLIESAGYVVLAIVLGIATVFVLRRRAL